MTALSASAERLSDDRLTPSPAGEMYLTCPSVRECRLSRSRLAKVVEGRSRRRSGVTVHVPGRAPAGRHQPERIAGVVVVGERYAVTNVERRLRT